MQHEGHSGRAGALARKETPPFAATRGRTVQVARSQPLGDEGVGFRGLSRSSRHV